MLGNCIPALQRRELSALGRICPALAIPKAAGRSHFGVFSQGMTVPGNNTWNPSIPFLAGTTSPPPCIRPSGFYFAFVLTGKFVERVLVSRPRGTSEGKAVSWFAKFEALNSYELD